MAGFGSISKIPELQRRLLFTAAMFAVYRIGCHVPVPGVNGAALTELLSSRQQTLFGLLNTFTGGAFERMSVFALGIMPYITSSIIFSLLAVVVPYLEQLQKEGELGRRKITQYTRYGTVLLSAVQSLMLAFWLEQQVNPSLVSAPGWAFRLMTIITLTSGTAFIMWLGEQITERGIGNGISLIIFAGIVARLPNDIADTLVMLSQGELSFFVLLGIGLLMVAVVGGIVFVERGQRRIPVQYPSRTVGRRMFKGVKTHLPLRINTAGVIPPIFASSILAFPQTFLQFLPSENPNMILQWINNALNMFGWQYNALYAAGIIFFTYFYTAVQFNPVDVADNLRKHGGYIPGVRPGKNTADHIDRVLTRITLGGALYLCAVCVLPSILVSSAGVPFWFGGTSLLIVVGVALDTAQQMEAHMLARHYDGFLGAKGPKMRGRRR